MKMAVVSLIVLAVLSLNGCAQEYTRWGLPEGAKMRLGKGRITDIEFSPNGNLLAAASLLGIWLYDTATLRETSFLTVNSGWVTSIAFSLDGGTLAGYKSTVNSLSFSPDGRALASGNRDRTVRVWDARTGEQLHKLVGHTAPVNSVVFSPDGSTLASGCMDHTVRLWNAETGEHLCTLRGHEARVQSVTFSPDGSALASCGDDSEIRLWDIKTGWAGD